MLHMIATMFKSLLTIAFMWAATVLVVIPWTISQENHLHLLGITMLGGGAIVASAVFTVRLTKHCWRNFFPGRSI